MAVTIRDVAEAAGVSPMAVSKVLHDRGSNVRVGKDTADLIRKIARELQYEPNALARSFRMRRTFSIGLVFEDWTRIAGGSQYFAHLLDGVTGAAFPAGYSVTICPRLVNGSSGNALNDGRFDGLIWAKFESTDQNLEGLERARVPIVALHASNKEIVQRGISSVCCDNVQAMRLAVDHLAGLGHKRIAMVVPDTLDRNDEVADRADSFQKAMAAHGLKGDVSVWDPQTPDFEAWWKSNPPHTALVCHSESQCGPILEQAHRLGVKLPEELSLVGFDSTAFCDTLSPRLTAISQPIEAMAERATQILLNLIAGNPEPARNVVFECGFDIRKSTSKPR